MENRYAHSRVIPGFLAPFEGVEMVVGFACSLRLGAWVSFFISINIIGERFIRVFR